MRGALHERLWAVALGLMLGLGGSACSEPELLDVGLLNCVEVRRGPHCIIEEGTSELAVFVQAVPDTEITAEGAHGELPVSCDGSLSSVRCKAQGRGNVVRISLSARRGTVQLRLNGPGRLRSSRFEISFSPSTPMVPWLEQAQRQWVEEMNLAGAEQTLRQHLGLNTLSVAERSQALSMLGQILGEEMRIDEAEETFKLAIQIEEQAGLLTSQSSDLLYWANLLYDQRSLAKEARLLEANQSVFSLVGEKRPWFWIYKAQMLQTLGQPDEALHALDEADRWNRVAGSVKSRNMSQVFRSSIQAQLGRIREDTFISSAERQLTEDSCALGLLLRRRAQMRIELLESELGDSTAVDPPTQKRLLSLWENWEPGLAADQEHLIKQHDGRIQSLLARSSAVLSGSAQDELRPEGSRPKSCRVLRHLTLVTLSQARLALLMGRWADAQRHLAEAQAGLLYAGVNPAKAPTFDLEWNRLSSHLARVEGRHDDALAFINRLEQHPGDDLGAFETRWTMHVGRALSFLMRSPSQRKEALAALWAADAVIEDASRSVPRLLGRGSLFGRFEWGSRLLVENLLHVDEAGVIQASQDELLSALGFIRHARTRALLELRRVNQLQRLDEKRTALWNSAAADYFMARHELDRARSNNSPAAQLQELEERTRSRLADTLEILGEGDQPKLRPLDPDEMFFACYPLRRRWACIAAMQGHVEAVTIETSSLSDAKAYARLAATLLEPFHAMLLRMKGKTLTVFGYGELREVPMHLLPFNGQRLGQWMRVRYSLDYGTPAVMNTVSQAILAVDGKLEVGQGKDEHLAIIEPLLGSLLSSHKWGTEFHELGWHGTSPGRALPSSIAALREAIPRAGLLFIFSHAEYAPANGWINAISFTRWNRLSGGDVLLMPRVPGRVVLIACNSGTAVDVVGGQESLGIAQAFLLRGSQEVLSTNRTVSREAGAAVAQSVSEHLAAHPEDSLNTAMEATIDHVLSATSVETIGENPGDRKLYGLFRARSELDSFRVLCL